MPSHQQVLPEFPQDLGGGCDAWLLETPQWASSQPCRGLCQQQQLFPPESTGVTLFLFTTAADTEMKISIWTKYSVHFPSLCVVVRIWCEETEGWGANLSAAERTQSHSERGTRTKLGYWFWHTQGQLSVCVYVFLWRSWHYIDVFTNYSGCNIKGKTWNYQPNAGQYFNPFQMTNVYI